MAAQKNGHRTNSMGLAALVASVLALGACAKGGQDYTSSIPADYRDRHPITLGHSNETMDIFAGRGAMDYRQTEDVRSFGQQYMTHGQGPLIAYLPTGANGAHISEGLNSIRKVLAAGGASGRLQVAHYQPQHGGAAPIRLAYARLKAQVAHKCGYEGDSITPITIQQSNSNLSPYNFGCSYQQNLAAQIDDPRDLIRPRQDGPVDVNKRVKAIERMRDGQMQELKPSGTSIRNAVGGT